MAETICPRPHAVNRFSLFPVSSMVVFLLVYYTPTGEGSFIADR